MYREVGVLAERQGFLSSILEETGTWERQSRNMRRTLCWLAGAGAVLWACLTKGGMPCIMAGENIPWF